MEHSQALAGSSQQIWLARVSDHPNVPEVYLTKQMGLTVCTKQTEKGRAKCRGRQWQLLDKHQTPFLPWISKLPGGIFDTNSRVNPSGK